MVTPVRAFAGAPARREKVRRIFELFDADGDGALGRSELAALVAAVNPGVVFTADQLCSVLDAVFRSYAGAADADGLSLAGLLRSYDDGAGDIDRDFAALFPDLAPNPKPGPSPSPNGPLSPLASPIHEIAFDSTRAAVARLETLIRNRAGASDGGFAKGLREIRANLDRSGTAEAASEGHVAIGRALFHARLLPEAVDCFQRAAELSPADPRAHFRLGTALSALGRARDARRSLSAALATASADALRWQALLPQIRVNLGVVLEREGLLLAAAEHYRAAARLCPTHYRALKLLGSALCGAGEHLRAVAALEEALLLKPDFPDALCDLGAALHAAGERDRAAQCFERALQLDGAHADAAFNLGGVFKDMGLYGRAVEAYGRALAARPDYWAAELNRAAVLLGAGEPAAAKKALEEAYKRTKRVELYNAILYVKKHEKRLREGNGVDFVVVGASAFKTADTRTTHARCLMDALCIRDIQKITRLGRIDVNLLRREMGGRERVATKAELEGVLRKLLHFLNVESFQEAMKVINEKILTILDATSSGKIDLSMFFAVVAPICTGPPENRKGVAFDFLSDNGGFNGRISKTDASIYLKYMRVIYFRKSHSFSDPVELGGQEEDSAKIWFSEFVDIFDDVDRGFGILPIVIKLEAMDSVRHSRQACGVCKYRIGGLMFKEIACHFWLCSSCYSERKVPSAFRKDEYMFKEYMIDK